MTKVQLSLTNQEAAILSAKADQLGYNLTKYLKFLISKAADASIAQDDLPSFPMSERLEEVGIQALKDHKAGKTISFNSIDELFES